MRRSAAPRSSSRRSSRGRQGRDLAHPRVSNSLSGVVIIQQATIAASAVEEIGGISKLTERELQRLGAQAQEASEKMAKMGIGVDPRIRAIADASKRAGDEARPAAPKVSGLHGAFAPVRRDPRIDRRAHWPGSEGAAELGEAAGKTVSQVGAVATAGLAAGAAFGGWKIGRLVSDVFGLDEAIGKLTARLFGLGDVEAEVAGAKADAMVRASQKMGFEVTSYSNAIEINADTQRTWQSQTAQSAKVLSDLAGKKPPARRRPRRPTPRHRREIGRCSGGPNAAGGHGRRARGRAGRDRDATGRGHDSDSASQTSVTPTRARSRNPTPGGHDGRGHGEGRRREREVPCGRPDGERQMKAAVGVDWSDIRTIRSSTCRRSRRTSGRPTPR